MKTNLLLTLLPALALCACAHDPVRGRAAEAGPEVIVAEGTADYNVRNIAASRAAAVQDAQRNAVRKVAELFADEASGAGGRTPADALAAAPLQNFVRKNKIISEGAEGTSYAVTLRVWVYPGKVAAALRGPNPAASRGGPRAVLVAREIPEGTVFSKAFKAALSRRSVMAVEDLPAGAVKADADDAALMAAASAAGADMLLKVSASAYLSGGGLNTGFYPSAADAAVKVFEVSSGKQLLDLSRQGSAVDSSQAASFSKALVSAAELLAQETATRVDRQLKTDPVVSLKVTGVSGLEMLERLKGEFSRLDLKKIVLESYSSGEAVFAAVPRRLDPQELASAVLRGDSLGLELQGASPKEITFFITK